jgi:4a-hydroxytetrahydrobiopterin dehydratase
MTLDFAIMKSQHRSGQALQDPDIQTHLSRLQGWRVVEGALEKSFAFKNFHQTMSFVNAVAWIAHTEDHHPDLAVSFNRCVVRFSTHSVKGLSLNDFICAAKTDALGASVG